MKIAYFFMCIFLLSSGCSYGGDSLSVHDFAVDLRGVITSGQVDKFNQLGCVPTKCIDNDDINYVFGTGGKIGFIKSFLSRPEVEIKTYGPFQYSDDSSSSDYIVMYYDPLLVRFDKNGNLSEEQRREMWWKAYVETVVSLKDGVWYFNRTPFYHGAHLPWAEDY